MACRSLVGENAIACVEKAMELAGGMSFYRKAGLERAFRDIQAARFHPLQAKPQRDFTGRVALGYVLSTYSARKLGLPDAWVTKLEARNRALASTRDFLTRIIEDSAEAIITRDEAGKITSWNRAAEAIYGWSAAEMIGRDIDRLLPPDGREREEIIKRALREAEQMKADLAARAREESEQMVARAREQGVRRPLIVTDKDGKTVSGARVVSASKAKAAS